MRSSSDVAEVYWPNSLGTCAAHVFSLRYTVSAKAMNSKEQRRLLDHKVDDDIILQKGFLCTIAPFDGRCYLCELS